jgi:serine O-acetyltransferase
MTPDAVNVSADINSTTPPAPGDATRAEPCRGNPRPADLASGPIGFFPQLIEDLRTYRWKLSMPGLQAILVYRLGHKAMRWPALVRKPFLLLYYPLFLFVRNVYGIELPRGCRIGRRVIFGHQHGIVLSQFVTIGDDCLIRQGVTIGAADHSRTDKAPRLGKRVEIGAGAVIIGDITIGDDVMIGANAVVIKDVPAGALAVGVPARVIIKDGRKAAGSAPAQGDAAQPG